MNVIALLSEDVDQWGAFDAAIVLAELLDGSLDLLIPSNGEQRVGALQERMRNNGAVSFSSVISLASTPLPAILMDDHHARKLLVAESPGWQTIDPLFASLAAWSGPAFFVPHGYSDSRPGFAERMIALTADAGQFDAAEPWIRTFARQAQSRVTLLSVINPDDASDHRLLDRFANARQDLGRGADRLRRSRLNVGWEIRLGIVKNEIIRLAETTGTKFVLLPPAQLAEEGLQLASELTIDSDLCVLSCGQIRLHAADDSRDGGTE